MITTNRKITTNIIGVDLINRFPKDTRNLDANKIRATIIADTNPLLDIEKASPKNIMGTDKYMNIRATLFFIAGIKKLTPIKDITQNIANSFGLPCNPASLIPNVACSVKMNPPFITPPVTEMTVPIIREHNIILRFAKFEIKVLVKIIKINSCMYVQNQSLLPDWN